MTTNLTPELLAECALLTCIEFNLRDPREIEKIARSNAFIFDIDEENVIRALHTHPRFKSWTGGGRENDS